MCYSMCYSRTRDTAKPGIYPDLPAYEPDSLVGVLIFVRRIRIGHIEMRCGY